MTSTSCRTWRTCSTQLSSPLALQLIEDLRKQLEHLQLFKLEAEQRRGRSSSLGLQEYNSRTRETELEQEIKQLKQVCGAGQGGKRLGCSVCTRGDSEDTGAVSGAPGAPWRGAGCGSGSPLLSRSPTLGQEGLAPSSEGQARALKIPSLCFVPWISTAHPTFPEVLQALPNWSQETLLFPVLCELLPLPSLA